MTRVLIWATNGFVLAALALLATQHARLALLLWLRAPDPSFAAAPPHDAEPPRIQPSGAAILERNPFDSRWDRRRAFEPSLADLAACESLRVSIVSESRDPTWSLASVTGVAGAPSRLMRAGDELDGKEVVHVGWDPWLGSPAVWMREHGVLCRVALFGAAAPGRSPTTHEAPSGERSSPWVVPDVLRRAIRARGDVTEIEPRAFEELLGNFARYAGPVRVSHPRNGAKGFELVGVRSGSVLSLIGLESGDVLRSVNGHDVGTPSALLAAHRELVSARRFVIAVERGGRARTLVLAVR